MTTSGSGESEAVRAMAWCKLCGMEAPTARVDARSRPARDDAGAGGASDTGGIGDRREAYADAKSVLRWRAAGSAGLPQMDGCQASRI